MRNGYLSILQAGLIANLPTVDSDADGPLPKIYYATDTNAVYILNPAHAGGAAYELLMQFKPVTVANLPTANLITGSEAVVSDATTPALGSTVAGAGAVQVAVIWNGTNWKVA
jgi:hypothetical protein